MKGLSVIITIVLLVLTNQLALYLKRAGALPADSAHHSSVSAAPYPGSFSRLETYPQSLPELFE